ncbi:MAG: DNA methylase [bacterium]|nr:DNA methylase [bacterium]
MARKPYLMTTTLWDFPSQQYGDEQQGDKAYAGATPAYVIWNLLQRYTKPKDLVIDPMAGSGTTLDVARDLGRRALGYDLQPQRSDIFRSDARKLPLETSKADFVFVDPPYSTHIKYSGLPECIGELDAAGKKYYKAMELVINEMERVLRPDRYAALYVSDSFRKGQPFCPIGFELFGRLRRRFEPVDVVAVVRHNKSLQRGNWHTAGVEGNFFLRGFNYLFIMYKPPTPRGKARSLALQGSHQRQPTPKAGRSEEQRPRGRSGPGRHSRPSETAKTKRRPKGRSKPIKRRPS